MHVPRSPLLTVLALTLLAAMASPAHAAPGRAVRASGPLTTYAVVDNPVAGVTAAVESVATGEGSTIVTLHLRGFGTAYEGQTFGAHAHVGPCAAGTTAGGHYTHPAAYADQPLEDREIWLDFTVTAGGTANARADRAWTFLANGANSVVIHALPTNPAGGAGTRLGCIPVDF